MLFEKADGIIDLRDRQAYQSGHLIGSTWLTLELLPESLNALPASPATLYLVGGKDQIEAASVLLDAKGYQVCGSLVIESEEMMAQWAQQMPGKVVSGKDSKTLWKPSPLVEEFVAKVSQGDLSFPLADQRPAVLDIACGGGRDAIFMAKSRMNVTAIDHEVKVLKRAKSLAELSGANLKFKCCDIKKSGCLPDQSYDLITVVRFLNREMFSYLLDALKPGGFVLFQTFVEGVEKFESPKNPNFILKEGELAQVFAGFEQITDRIDFLADGRPVNSFIARKPL